MIILGDARNLPLADESVDAIITDPPYEMDFQRRAWDRSGVAYDVETWREAHRVLKPGARMLVFGGPRTHHRIWCAIEDAGFVLEDTIGWLYASGWPKHRWKLKPAYEPIAVARKEPVTELNIDAARIPPDARWPANVALDEDAAALLDDEFPGISRFYYCPKPSYAERNAGLERFPLRNVQKLNPSGIAARRAAAGQGLGRNHHPTVKPVDLIRWLVRLVTRPGDLVLDQFAGSGTTGVACTLEGRRFILVENDSEYCEIAEHRVAAAPLPLPLFTAAGAGD